MFVTFNLGSASALEIVGPSNAIYVDPAGSDATGTRGNAARPFLTMAAALAVAQSGDEVLVAPGTFSGAFSLPAIANLTIRGSGATFTVLTAANNLDVATLATANRKITFENLAITSLGTGRTIVGTGAAAAGAWLNTGLIVRDCWLTTAGTAVNAVDLTYAGLVILDDVFVVAGSTNFVTCSTVAHQNATSIAGNEVTTWDQTDVARPAVGQGETTFVASNVKGSLTLGGEARLAGDAASSLGSLTGNALAVSGATVPRINWAGSVGAVDFQSVAAKQIPDTATALTLNLAGATLGGNQSWKVAGAAQAQAVDYTGATARAATTFLADAGIAMTAKGAAFATPTYTTAGTGTIVPPPLTILATAAIADTTVNFGFTAGNTNYACAVLATNAAGTPVTQGAKNTTNTHIAIGGAPAGTIDVTVTWR